jgi:hypothetical protein
MRGNSRMYHLTETVREFSIRSNSRGIDMKYSSSLHSRGTGMKHLMSLALVFGILALSLCGDALAQTGSEEESTESAGRTGTESGTRSREDTGAPGTEGTEGGMRDRTTFPDTTDPESGTRSRGTTTGNPDMTGTERGPRKPGNNGDMGTKSRSGSGNGSGSRSGTGSGTGTGGAPRSPE